MKNHLDYITHINNPEDQVYLKTCHFPVNIRLFHSSEDYKKIILDQCKYIKKLCLEEKEGYKKPHGMSSANAGLSFNIIGVTMNRNFRSEYCKILINPKILKYCGETIETSSNCGSLTLANPIKVLRSESVIVDYYDIDGINHIEEFNRDRGGFTIQHEIDHNNGILITDRIK